MFKKKNDWVIVFHNGYYAACGDAAAIRIIEKKRGCKVVEIGLSQAEALKKVSELNVDNPCLPGKDL